MNHMDTIDSQVERIVRESEIEAVVRALRTGKTPRIGEMLDYEIERVNQKSNRCRPYRVAVEQWHLDAARRILGPNSRASPEGDS